MAGLHVPLSTLRHHPRGPSTHDWGPPWIASPSMSGVLIPFLMPVYPGAFPTLHAEAADRTRVACMPGTTWPVGGRPPGSSRATADRPGFDVTLLLDTSAAIRSRSPSRSPPDTLTRAFSSTLTTTVFSQRSSRWFDASPRRATPEGQQSSIFYTAPHPARSPTPSDLPFRARGAPAGVIGLVVELPAVVFAHGSTRL
jgi:hypothetical protein